MLSCCQDGGSSLWVGSFGGRLYDQMVLLLPYHSGRRHWQAPLTTAVVRTHFLSSNSPATCILGQAKSIRNSFLSPHSEFSSSVSFLSNFLLCKEQNREYDIILKNEFRRHRSKCPNPSFTTYPGKLLSSSELLISILENIETNVYIYRIVRIK